MPIHWLVGRALTKASAAAKNTLRLLNCQARTSQTEPDVRKL
jgi:hypothetical protein